MTVRLALPLFLSGLVSAVELVLICSATELLPASVAYALWSLP
jgi:multidrug transporter EmrE-like cation transporter